MVRSSTNVYSYGTDSYRSQVKMSELKKTGPRPPHPTGQNTYPAGSIRQRILEAAFNLFSESGFSPTSTLDIVTRARVSKRDLYALFRNKHAVLAACIHERTEHMRRPLDTAAPIPQTRDALAKFLIEFGACAKRRQSVKLRRVPVRLRNIDGLA